LRIATAVDQSAAARNPVAEVDKTKAFDLPVEEITAHPDTARALKAALGCSLPRATAFPLKTPHGETVGVLCLLGMATPALDPSNTIPHLPSNTLAALVYVLYEENSTARP
jgi:hypothetical protein